MSFSAAVLFLASDEARYITGTALPVDAGIVTKAAGSQRHVVWVAGEVTSALDDFAARARRLGR